MGGSRRESLLASLGQAAGLCPQIEASLTAAPGGYELDATGAYEFLTEKAQALEQVGFGVLLPGVVDTKGTKLRLTARADVTSPKFEGKGGSRSIDRPISVAVALGDEVLRLKNWKRWRSSSAAGKVRGQWVQLNAEEIQAALDFWKKRATGKATVRELVRMAWRGQGTGRHRVCGVTAQRLDRRSSWPARGAAAFAELPTRRRIPRHAAALPGARLFLAGLSAPLGLGACLADDMGLGKTIQTLALIQRDWERERRTGAGAAGLPDVGGRQLAQEAALHARSCRS